MNNINFLIPVQTFKQHIQEGIKDSFYLGGKSAHVIPGKIVDNCQEVILKNKNQNKIKQIVAVVSCITLAILLVRLAVKAVFRFTCTFYVDPDIQQPTETAARAVLRKCHASAQTNNNNAITDLMCQFTAAWRVGTNSFEFLPHSFNLENFSAHLSKHADDFQQVGVTNDAHFGYIEKFDLDPSDNPRIYMRADLHGDLKSLLENIRSLQQEGLLDDNFNCKSGVHLVFLGDYCDRGIYGTQILELLMQLRENNPQQVHLIRGNHEYNSINAQVGYSDKNLMQIIENKESREALERFYETMSLTTYFSVNQGENREYVQCTHGLFELTMDPAPLLDHVGSDVYLPVPKTRKLSKRVCTIAKSNSKLSQAARRIYTLVQQYQSLEEEDLTAYNWGDVTEMATRIGSVGRRRYALCAQDIRHYLDLSSEQHRVMMIFRGHQHRFQHLMYEDEVLVTTLPVGMDCPAYQNFIQSDRAYIIKPSSQVKDWTKQAILRETGQNETDKITSKYPLTSGVF